jgi:hypothetical protein
MAIWGRRSAPNRRRTGPPDEEPWWDAADQALVERPLLRHRDLGKGWIPTPMLNNLERLDPHGDDPASERVRQARAARRLTALDEGAAWRRRSDAALLVARIECFSAADEGGHRRAWQADAESSLDAVWRARWRERDREPGWIEARRRAPADLPDLVRPGGAGAAPGIDRIDWCTIEDHPGVAETEVVTAYEHLVLWVDRLLVTLTLRHHHGDAAEEVAARAAATALVRLDDLSRRSGPAPGSA